MLEREEQGLPYINRNYVDPAKLELPSDEELDGAAVLIQKEDIDFQKTLFILLFENTKKKQLKKK